MYTMKALTVATDCTGLDAPLYCLKGIVDRTIEYVFASDINPKVRSFLESSTPRPQTIFANINDRTENHKYRGIDLYVAGFPCQTFSSLGKRKGLEGTNGSVFWRILEFLREAQPRVFVLENVGKLMTHAKGETFASILRQLRSIGCYHVSFRKMSPVDICFPQSRTRVFIIGAHTTKTRGSYKWPEAGSATPVLLESLLMGREEALTLQPSCCRPLCPTAIRNIDALALPDRLFIVDLATSRAFASKNPRPCCCPCLKRYNQMFYISTQRRYLTFRECLRLQGFGDEIFASKSDIFSVTDLHQLAGNSMCVPVLRIVLQCVLQLLEPEGENSASLHSEITPTSSTPIHTPAPANSSHAYIHDAMRCRDHWVNKI